MTNHNELGDSYAMEIAEQHAARLANADGKLLKGWIDMPPSDRRRVTQFYCESTLTAPVDADLAQGVIEAYQRDQDPGSALLLAYFIRRGRFDTAEVGSLEDLLAPLVENRDSEAMLQQALAYAAGIQYSVDWRQADELVASAAVAGSDYPANERLTSIHPYDGESNLVRGWFGRHRIITDMTLGEMRKHLSRATDTGWDIPAWMYKKAPAP